MSTEDGYENSPDELLAALERYLPRLIQLADKSISERYRAKIEAEDVAASVCRTFIRHVGKGSFRIENDEDLWKLLVTITLNKARNKARGFSTEKRDVSQEVAFEDPGLIAALRSHPSPVEAAEFVDMLSVLAARLDDEMATQVLLGLVNGKKVIEIAGELGVTTKTVQRKKVRIREELSNLNE